MAPVYRHVSYVDTQTWLWMAETTPATFHRKWGQTVMLRMFPREGQNSEGQGSEQGEKQLQRHSVVTRRPGTLGSVGCELVPGCAVGKPCISLGSSTAKRLK